MRKQLLLIFLWCSLSLFSQWEVVTTENLALYYPHSLQEQASVFLSRIEAYKETIKSYTGHDHYDLNLVLQDIGVQSGGYVSVFPEKMVLHPSIPSSFDWPGARDYYDLLVSHELTHAFHLTETNGIDATLKKIFGTPFYGNTYLPTWFIEGLAVNVESSFDPYSGRLNDGYYRGMMGALVKQDLMPSLQKMSAPYSYYLYGRKPYLYGAFFLNYIERRFGREKLKNFIQLQGETFKSYFGLIYPGIGFEKNAKAVFGESFESLYQEWLVEINETYRDFSLPAEGLSNTMGYKRFLTVYDGSVYFVETAFLEPDVNALWFPRNLRKLDIKTHKIETISSLGKEVVSPLQFLDGKMYCLLRSTEKGFSNYDESGFGSVNELVSFDLETKTWTTLALGSIRSFVVAADQSIYVFKHTQNPYQHGCFQIKDGEESFVKNIDILTSEWVYYQSDLFCIAKEAGKSWNVYQVQLDSMTFTPVFSTPYSLFYLKSTEDGLTFIANKGKQYQLYSLDLETKDIKKQSQTDFILDGVLVDHTIIGSTFLGQGENIFVEPGKNELISFGPEQSAIMHEDVLQAEGQLFTAHDSVRSAFQPYSRGFPYIFSGQDVVSRMTYKMSYSARSIFTTYIDFSIYPNLKVGTQFGNGLDYGFLNYSVCRLAGFGLGDVSLDLVVNPELGTFMSSDISFSTQYTSLVVHPGMNINGEGSTLATAMTLYGQDYSVSFSGSTFTTYPTRSYVRGFENIVYSDGSGTVYSLDAKKLLYRLRQTYWAPFVGLGDVYCDVFYDHSSLYPDGGAYGIQLISEAVAGLNSDVMNLAPGIGLSRSNGMNAVFLTLEATFSF